MKGGATSVISYTWARQKPWGLGQNAAE